VVSSASKSGVYIRDVLMGTHRVVVLSNAMAPLMAGLVSVIRISTQNMGGWYNGGGDFWSVCMWHTLRVHWT
jgi:hypothetical protein